MSPPCDQRAVLGFFYEQTAGYHGIAGRRDGRESLALALATQIQTCRFRGQECPLFLFLVRASRAGLSRRVEQHISIQAQARTSLLAPEIPQCASTVHRLCFHCESSEKFTIPGARTFPLMQVHPPVP
jgi:hypothetical protein